MASYFLSYFSWHANRGVFQLFVFSLEFSYENNVGILFQVI
jgi:hypothetical protein